MIVIKWGEKTIINCNSTRVNIVKSSVAQQVFIVVIL